VCVKLVNLVNPSNFLLLIQLDVLQNFLNSSTQDVWTLPIPSTSGCRYYELFVDDYSRFTWLYPILSKAEVFQCFVKFSCLLKIYSQLKSNNYNMTMVENIPQSNSRITFLKVEVGLTLLAQSGLSTKFLVDSVLTAIYLINRLLTHVLQQESPFSKLMKRAPDYTLLRTFGCLCYPLLRPYANHKLSFRSKPCIFIGYRGNQKGYRCLDPTNNKIFLSWSVISDETQFPAQSKSISLGSCQVTATSDDPLVFLPLPYFNNPNHNWQQLVLTLSIR
jgi:hypothetical protein